MQGTFLKALRVLEKLEYLKLWNSKGYLNFDTQQPSDLGNLFQFRTGDPTYSVKKAKLIVELSFKFES